MAATDAPEIEAASAAPELRYAKHGKWANTMTTDEILAATDNYDKLMNRCWYAVAGNAFPDNLDGFWEINWCV